MRQIHIGRDNLDVPNPGTPARPAAEPLTRRPGGGAPAWLWLVAVVAVALVALVVLGMGWGFVAPLHDLFRGMLVEYAAWVRGLLFVAFGMAVLGLGVGAWRAIVGLAGGAEALGRRARVVRTEADHPVDVNDLTSAAARPFYRGQLATAQVARYDVQGRYADASTLWGVSGYGPHWSYRYDSNGVPVAPVDEAAPLALPPFAAGKSVLQQLADRGHIARSGRSLFVGYAVDGTPLYIEMDSCGFGIIGGQARSGKTALVSLLVGQAVLMGWEVVVCDWHAQKPTGLIQRLRPLSGRLLRQAGTPQEIEHAIRWVDKIAQRRLEGQRRPDDRPVLLIVDEYSNLAIRQLLPPDVMALLPAMAMSHAGVGVHGLVVGHDFSRQAFGGQLGTTLRRSATHRVVTKIAADAAELILPSTADAQQAQSLRPGQAIFWGDEQAQLVSVPYIDQPDLEFAAGGAPPRPYTPPPPQLTAGPVLTPPPAAPDAPAAAAAAPGAPAVPAPARTVPTTERLPPLTIAQSIVMYLQGRDWTLGVDVADGLGEPRDVVLAELTTLLRAGTLERDGRRSQYKYRLK